jgi:isopentenyl-diphosphate delta-isomerase
MEEVILVDIEDNAIGQMEKLKAHEEGHLHRAFSILIFNNQGEILLQQRALSKYHSGGLWTNTCCSHPRPNEVALEAANRRLMEEMGFTTDLEFVFKFIYKAKLDHDLTEHEFDHVFTGTFNDTPKINLEEANDWKWMNMKSLSQDIQINPDHYTVWFKDIMKNQELTKNIASLLTAS